MFDEIKTRLMQTLEPRRHGWIGVFNSSCFRVMLACANNAHVRFRRKLHFFLTPFSLVRARMRVDLTMTE